MSKKGGVFLAVAGTVLILSALSLSFYNRCEDVQAGQEAENLLGSVQSAMAERAERETIPEETGTAVSTESEAFPEPQDPELPVVELEGYGYVGTICVPALELELPVMSEWDYDRLRIAPCRQFGSSRTDDLVIAAHNYKTHFGLLKQLSIGDIVTFTDMDGIVNDYAVVRMDNLQPTDVEAVQNSGCDLVLYTCTEGGAARIVVFCDRVQSEKASSCAPAEKGESMAGRTAADRKSG